MDRKHMAIDIWYRIVGGIVIGGVVFLMMLAEGDKISLWVRGLIALVLCTLAIIRGVDTEKFWENPDNPEAYLGNDNKKR